MDQLIRVIFPIMNNQIRTICLCASVMKFVEGYQLQQRQQGTTTKCCCSNNQEEDTG